MAGVTGGALWSPAPEPEGEFTHAIGACAGWLNRSPLGILAEASREALRTGRPALMGQCEIDGSGHTERVPFAGVLPVISEGTARGVSVITGPTRAPFTVLGEDFLLALGQQIGAALETADVDQQLKGRTAELERLSIELIHQHEDQRRRLARELHDETAQVFTAMKLQLGLLRETAGPGAEKRIARAKGLNERLTISRHAIKNALIPVVTVVGLQVGYLLGGDILIEIVFSYPGVGLAMVNGILAKDFPLVQGAILMVASSYVFVNLAVDVAYAYLDPRIRYER